MKKKLMVTMKKNMASLRETAMSVVGALLIAYAIRPFPVYAAGGYTAPLDNLKTILITISGSAGVILVVYGGIRFAISFQKMDQNGEHQAVFTIIAGGILIGLSAVLGVLGV